MTLIRVPRPHSRVIELEEGSFTALMEQAEGVRRNAPLRGDRAQRVEIVIEVTRDDPEKGRLETIDVLGRRITMRLGARWEYWRTFATVSWTLFHEAQLRPPAGGNPYLPDTDTLLREAQRAGALAARSAVRSTV